MRPELVQGPPLAKRTPFDKRRPELVEGLRSQNL
jgi:hypothetical protein